MKRKNELSKWSQYALVLLVSVMCLLSLYWFYAATGLLAGLDLAIVLSGILILALLFVSKKGLRWAGLVLQKAMPISLILLVSLQIAMLLSTNLMIRSDAAMVYNGASKLVDSAIISSYLTENTNNLTLFLYERFFYNIFGSNAIWVLQGLNMLFVDSAAIGLYGLALRFFNKKTAVISFYAYLLILAATPQFLAMYTDVMAMPIVVWQLYLVFSLMDQKSLAWSGVLMRGVFLGSLSGLAYAIRPPLLVLMIAFFMMLFLYGKAKLLLQASLGFLLGFALLFVTLTVIQKNQDQVEITYGQSKTSLAFIDLGLTYLGTDQADFQSGLALFTDEVTDGSYDGRYSNEVVLKDIKRRLEDYSLSTFVGHLLLKSSLTLRDGTLGWTYKDASLEGASFQNPLYEKFKDQSWAKWISSHLIYTDQEHFVFARSYLQLVWLVLILGLLLVFLWPRSLGIKEHFLLLALLGGFLFLMVFEGSKTRYMIQFLPQFLLLSAAGFDKLITRRLS
ncbi:glycosyltransferase family 39 protein [Streptococcus loxodontisalivarius]|uniref:Integral membrane protein (TIGR03766 family) n=1 Tax=Streptococcus loxodontisalivarius TaxID=1349415 RepID=A0ABS2PR82_9STRE|nr:glycosyltransferase family 39 protein [Streptococcus loxodontisalivarius]MBM7642431.1 integral membrane protein (TIGR03766 family) [Streptococcus loxodontisalivarius]